MAPPADPTRRFSSRVQDYVRYRPSYPAALVESLRNDGALPSHAVVADVGSGTGLLTELFLKTGHRVFGVEPNAQMRRAGEEFLRDSARFVSVDGTAEATTLPPESVDLVTAGQAFHWFDRDKTKAEFARILRSGGTVALIWNERVTATTGFLRAYEELLRKFSTDYAATDHRRMTPEVIQDFFAPHAMKVATFPNEQQFDFEGVRGRLLSSSYAPAAGHPQHEAMLQHVRDIFDRHHHNGVVTFHYETRMYFGKFN